MSAKSTMAIQSQVRQDVIPFTRVRNISIQYRIVCTQFIMDKTINREKCIVDRNQNTIRKSYSSISIFISFCNYFKPHLNDINSLQEHYILWPVPQETQLLIKQSFSYVFHLP